MTDFSEPLLNSEERSWTQRTFGPLTPSGVRSSIFSFSSGTLGAGVLSLPYAMEACGLGNGCLVLLLVGVCYYEFYNWFVLASEKMQSFTYVGVMEARFGFKGKHIMEIVLVVDSLGSITIMNTFLYEFSLRNLQEFEIASEGTPAVRAVSLLLIAIFLQLPLCLPEKIQSLRFASMLSVACVLYVTLVVVCQSPSYILLAKTPLELFRWDMKALDAIGIILFAFSNPMMMPLIYDELERRSPKRMDKVLKRSFLLLGVLYLTMGILGYLSYVDAIPDIVIQRSNIHFGFDYFILFGRIIYLITIMMQVPYCLYPGRIAVQQLLGGTNFEPNAKRYYFLTFLFLALPLILAIAIPSVIFFFKVVGSVTAMLMGIVFPILTSWDIVPSSFSKYVMVAAAVGLCGLAIACTMTLFLH